MPKITTNKTKEVKMKETKEEIRWKKMKEKMKGKEFDILSEITRDDILVVYGRLEQIIAREEHGTPGQSEASYLEDKKRITSVKKISYYLRDLIAWKESLPPLKETLRKSLNA